MALSDTLMLLWDIFSLIISFLFLLVYSKVSIFLHSLGVFGSLVRHLKGEWYLAICPVHAAAATKLYALEYNLV